MALSVFVLVAILIALAALASCTRVFRVESESMAPTPRVGDRLLATRHARWLARPKHGAIVILGGGDVERSPFVLTNGQTPRMVVKRVLAVGGDVVRFDGSNIKVGRPGPALLPVDACVATPPSHVSVPVNSLYVVGDCRGVSYDSRHYGPVRTETVVAVARAVVWPPRRARCLQ